MTKKPLPAKVPAKPAAKPPVATKPKASQSVAVVADYEDDIGGGLQNVNASDILIPRIQILQGLSPQVTRGNPDYDPKLQVGMIYDASRREIIAEPARIVPVYYTKSWVEWEPRDASAKRPPVEIYPTDEIMRQTEKDPNTGKFILPNGNIIEETAMWYVLNWDYRLRRSVISLKVTQLKKHKMWVTLATEEFIKRADGSEYLAPLYARSYALGTVPESNKRGNWIGWTIERGDRLEELCEQGKLDFPTIKAECIRFRKSIMAGEVKADLAPGSDEGVVVDDDRM